VADNAIPSLSATQTFQVVVSSFVPPTITTPVWSGGQFSLTVTGQPGPEFAVEASTNLVGWSALWTTNSIPFDWVDTNAGAYPTRFYRLVLGPP